MEHILVEVQELEEKHQLNTGTPMDACVWARACARV